VNGATGGSDASGGSAVGSGGTSATGGTVSGGTGGGDTSSGGVSTGGTSTGGTSGAPSIGDVDSKGRKLVWAEEFTGPEINRALWGNEVGYPLRNDEEQNYTTNAKNQFIENGELVIRAIAEKPAGGGNYSSASLTTEGKQTFRYGRLEGRMKVPGAKGCWPAFWLLPALKDKYNGYPPYNSWWPGGGEIDIMEFVSQDQRTVYGTAHYLGEDGKHAMNGGNRLLAAPVAADYHVFAIEWTPTLIEWYVDDQKYHSFNSTGPFYGLYPFQDPMYLIVNLAIGGTWPEDPDPTKYPQDFRIDWIRYWAPQ
jgi:beta-glucanase (GH16 family)